MFRIKQYAVFFCAAFLIGGCSLKPNVTLTDSGQVLPDYRPLLQLDQPGNTWEDRNQAQIPPVQIYMDNTGSMEGFIFDEIMNDNHADPKFVHMMRAFREMENTFFKTSCYTIHQNEQTGGIRNWLEYGGSIYHDFNYKGFYFSWTNDDDDGNANGPLSLLYLDKGDLDPRCINIVMTDLAEQNVNNTQLAQEIYKMCSQNGCDAYMLAFQFDYHGEAEVADPDRINGIISKRIDGPRPYYVIFTGPSQYIDRYMEQFLTFLNYFQLYEDKDFYLAKSKLEWDESVLDKKDIVFQRASSYDEIKQEIQDGEILELSKNICPYDEPEDLFDGNSDNRIFAFYYQKGDGISKKYNDWRLNFQIPVSNSGKNTAIEYSIDQTYYIPVWTEIEKAEDGESMTEQSEGEKIGKETLGTETAEPQWKHIENPEFDESIEWVSGNEDNIQQKTVSVKLSGKPDKELKTDTVLMILTIIQKEEIVYKKPDWLSNFDTGLGDDYFQKTYNLSGFYDVLFGSGYLTTKNGKLVSSHIYAQIPILITGLRGGER
jgi:hypothetical protein